MNERFERIKKRFKRIFWKKKNIPLALVSLFGLFFLYLTVFKDLPSPSRLGSSEIAQSTRIFDRNDKLLFTIYRNRDLTSIPLSDVPKQMQQATIAIEDKNFYYHGAIDLRGISRALVAIFFHQRIEGG